MGFRAGADYQCWQDARERLLAVNRKIVHFDELAGLLLAFDGLAEALGVLRHAVGDVYAQANLGARIERQRVGDYGRCRRRGHRGH